jgi:hypothetical protein
MNSFELELWDDEGAMCIFYAVKNEEEIGNETDKFFSKYEDESHLYHTAALEILNLIQVIGHQYGATDDFINRTENKAHSLPPKPQRRIKVIRELGIHFPLRLYCYRIREDVLVLFNGGLKEANSHQGSPDLSFKFYQVQNYVSKIEAALSEGMIVYNTKTKRLEDFQGNIELIL